VSSETTLFLAVRLPPPAIACAYHLLTELAELGPVVRPVRADGLHLTLQFLGRVRSEQEGLVGEAARRTAGKHVPFNLGLTGIGNFSAASRPQVIWLGTSAGGGELAALAAGLRSELEAAGLPFDRRRFRAHCTLARVSGGPGAAAAAGLRQMAARTEPGPASSFLVRDFQLLESVAEPGGPNRYPTRATFVLATSAGRPSSPLERAPVEGMDSGE
jgi:2'-5' RNA ligase